MVYCSTAEVRRALKILSCICIRVPDQKRIQVFLKDLDLNVGIQIWTSGNGLGRLAPDPEMYEITFNM
jgi:hypothetical protein